MDPRSGCDPVEDPEDDPGGGGTPGTIGEGLAAWGHRKRSPTSFSFSTSCSAVPGKGWTTNWRDDPPVIPQSYLSEKKGFQLCDKVFQLFHHPEITCRPPLPEKNGCFQLQESTSNDSFQTLTKDFQLALKEFGLAAVQNFRRQWRPPDNFSDTREILLKTRDQ